MSAGIAGIVAVGILGALAAPDVLSQPLISGEATVIDGDTIDIRSGTVAMRDQVGAAHAYAATRVRIQGIDAPELRQMCGVIHCGPAAKRALQDAIGGAVVTCKPSGLDRYGRTLAQCATATVRDLGAHLVGTGYAQSARKYGDRYRDAENAARVENLGFWRTGNFGDPEAWRRGNGR